MPTSSWTGENWADVAWQMGKQTELPIRRQHNQTIQLFGQIESSYTRIIINTGHREIGLVLAGH